MSLSVPQAQNGLAGSASAVTITPTGATTTGNLLVVFTRESANATSTVTMTDSAGTNTWVQAGSYIAQSTTRAGMFYAANANSVTTVTATWSGALSTQVTGVMFEIAGAAKTSPLDGTPGTSITAGATSLTSGTLTTTNANDILIYGVGLSGTSGGFTVGSGYTFPTNSTGSTVAMQYEIVSATQSGVTTSMSWITSRAGQSVFAAFMAAASSAVGGGGGDKVQDFRAFII